MWNPIFRKLFIIFDKTIDKSITIEYNCLNPNSHCNIMRNAEWLIEHQGAQNE